MILIKDIEAPIFSENEVSAFRSACLAREKNHNRVAIVVFSILYAVIAVSTWISKDLDIVEDDVVPLSLIGVIVTVILGSFVSLVTKGIHQSINPLKLKLIDSAGFASTELEANFGYKIGTETVLSSSLPHIAKFAKENQDINFYLKRINQSGRDLYNFELDFFDSLEANAENKRAKGYLAAL